MASSEGIAAADLVEKVPSSRQVRYEGRLMNIEAVQRAEKEMDEAELAVEQEHRLTMRGVAEEEAALRLRLQTILARKEHSLPQPLSFSCKLISDKRTIKHKPIDLFLFLLWRSAKRLPISKSPAPDTTYLFTAIHHGHSDV